MDVIWVSANMPPVISTRPKGTIRPTGILSVSAPAIGMVSIAPMPCGATQQAGVERGLAADLLEVASGPAAGRRRTRRANRNIVIAATRRSRLRNRRRSSSGCSGRKACRTNATISTSADEPSGSSTLADANVPSPGIEETP